MAQNLKINITAKDKTQQAFQGVRGKLKGLKDSIFSVQGALVGLGGGLAIRSIVGTGRSIEDLQVRLKQLFGSTQEGAKAFDVMANFASKVPFSLEQIQQASGNLAVVAGDANQLSKILEITGNVAAVTGLDFATTAEQIQRSFSAGIGAADLFREKGVRNMLGFQAGAAVSIEATAEAFQKVFGRGGRFGQATDDLANTFEGTISMLNDKVFSFKKTLLDAGFFAELKKQFGDLDEFLNDNAEQLEQIAITIGTNLAQGTIKAAEGIKILADSFRDFQTILGLVLFALGGFTMKLAGAALVIDDINRRIRKLTGETVIEFEKIAKFEHELSIPLKNLKEEAELALVPIREFEHELSVGVPTATQKAISKFRQLNSSAVTNLENKFKNIRMTIAEGINNGITKMSQSIARAFVFGEKLSDTFKNIARSLLVNIIGALIEIVARKGVELAIEKLITREKQKQAALSSVSGSGSLFSTARSFLGFAKGGAVSKGQPIVVGERGAEVFVPNQTGQITQAARGTDGGMTTVNFNINTLDASGFDDLLVRNRGTITQIINNAVNERGSKNLI